MIRKFLAGAVVTGLTLGLSALPAPGTTVTNGPLTVSVANTIVYKTARCLDYPFTVRLNTTSPDTHYSIDVTAWTPASSAGGSEYLYGYTNANGDINRTGWMNLCPWFDGPGRLTYTAKAEWTEEYTVQVWDATHDFVCNEATGECEWVGAWVTETRTRERTATASAATVLKTPATVTIKSSNTRPRLGKAVKFTGKATYRDRWWDVRAAKKQSVTLQFKPAGSSAWSYRGTDRTSKSGKYYFKVKPRQDGYYRVVYNSGMSTGTSRAVYINVR